ncbi:Hypothetical Protein FCC1311_043832 [Hondaea fermentalgiana]|uniref:Roadblock/LAMTOR2 domain-containing protein n=1 Tax=Hondaea fermentalgiana TaxID=2315210 RepID=A0A2R5GAX5_9STRA|nr:Hypothetical Protein FCC1311_043832 [Hondaea fermentalgiana]|eukprot:GBG28160.1 Hypothetical Protein FCC1311_043832 [Hondaea fermentalgiana]
MSSTEVQAAILSNLWNDYQHAGARIQGGDLDMLVLNCESGRIGAMKLCDGYIVAAAGRDASTRVLREELGRLRDALSPVLASLEMDDAAGDASAVGTVAGVNA